MEHYQNSTLLAPKPRALEQGQADRSKAAIQIEGRIRDLEMFNLAIDSKLGGTIGCGSFAIHPALPTPSSYVRWITYVGLAF